MKIFGGFTNRNNWLFMWFRVINTLTKNTAPEKEAKTMKELQNYIENFGFGISAAKLADKAYNYMAAKGHKVCLVNERYLEVDGTTYLFSKSKKHGRWIAKAF